MKFNHSSVRGICHCPMLGAAALLISLASSAQPPPMYQEIKTAPLDQFLASASSNHWVCPAIYSAWSVGRMATTGTARAECEAARSFGLDMAHRLNVWAREMNASTGSVAASRLTGQFFDLADWIAATPGYGNLLLASRCHNIASIGLGRLIVDLQFPISSLSSMVARLDVLWQQPAVRAEILNLEVGTNLFVVASNEPAACQKVLDDVWKNGTILCVMRDFPAVAAVVAGKQPKPGYESFALRLGPGRYVPDESPVYTGNLSFFEDDDDRANAKQPKSRSTIGMWDFKWHQKFINGFGGESRLKALFAFRSCVGRFPLQTVYTEAERASLAAEMEKAAKQGLKVVPTESAFSSPGLAAFAQAWEPHATPQTWTLYAGAWTAYSSITSGNYVDQEANEP